MLPKELKYITIAICTYNREKYLNKCLESLFEQIKQYSMVEILVVDNNSSDQTKEVCTAFKKRGMLLRYYKESKQGLSQARNAAYKNTTATWVAYLDDDGIAHTNYVSRLVETAKEFPCDCFGGMYYAYYETKKPKWIADDFGTKKQITSQRSVIDKEFLSGGNFACKRSILEELKGFSTQLGMCGLKTGYGEEDDFQYRLRLAGYVIAFDPKLGIDHLVANYKLKPNWHIKRAYYMHKDMRLEGNPYPTLGAVIREVFMVSIKYIPRFSLRYIKEKDYSWQQFYIAIFGNYARVLGCYKNKNYHY